MSRKTERKKQEEIQKVQSENCVALVALWMKENPEKWGGTEEKLPENPEVALFIRNDKQLFFGVLMGNMEKVGERLKVLRDDAERKSDED